jgi:hypothetical protein
MTTGVVYAILVNATHSFLKAGEQSMNVRNVRITAALLAVGLTVGLQASTLGSAGAVTPLKITSVTPNPTTINITTASKNYTVAWSGSATFPMTVNVVPEPSCSTATFTCNKRTTKFTKRSNKLVLTTTCSINAGSSPGSHTGTWNVQLVDAHGKKSPLAHHTVKCSWS